MIKYYLIICLFAIAQISCDNKPKVIQASVENSAKSSKQSSTGVFESNKKESDKTEDIATAKPDGFHQIEVLEILPTDKYVYLKVKEDAEEYWVATGKQEVQIGGSYFFRDGLLKTNFESKEYNRTFDKVYLVSKLVPQIHGTQNVESPISEETAKVKTSDAPKIKGSKSIKEIIENASQYDGKEVQISGTCTKLNANIMGRNWIHLKDGTLDDYDFVITADQAVPEGHQVTMKGTVSLNRDFGSGYRYDVIIENASLVRE